ncbi:MAG: PAS domain-containing sensor histidine kinase [Planctomycetota bacterium]|jgi:signal transduction histidine kinase/PAS domain-containing protein
MSSETSGNDQPGNTLATHDELHEALFEYNPSQTIVVDNQGRIITYNKAKRESGDRLPNEGDIIFKDYAGKYDIDMYSELLECISNGETRVFGAQKYVDKVLCTTIAPFPGGAIIITEDVTDEKNAEEFNKALFEYNPSQTIVVDEQGKIITYNKAKHDSGDRLPAIGDVMFKNYAGRYDIDMYSELAECIRTGKTGQCPEQRYVDKILSTTISPFPGGAIIITEDVTAKAEAKKGLKQANEELKEKGRLQTAFVTNVSHELRTGLCIFRNTISNLTASGKYKLDKKIGESLKIADESVGRLGQVIDDFIALSEIETGKAKLSCSQIDFGSLISDIAKEIKPFAKAKNVKLKTKAHGDVTACADRDKIEQVLRQLLDNAIKFTGKRGKIEISADGSGDEVTVSIKDNGPGIKSENLEKVFDCFAKFEAAKLCNSTGVGLGLTLTKELVEMQGGRIWVESTVGAGSTFFFTVPKQP